METELTKRMKNLTHNYKPLMDSKLRTIRYADEVWTPSGIVDSIRFEDYVSDSYEDCRRINYETYLSETNCKSLLKQSQEEGSPLGECKIASEHFPNKNCHGCIYKIRQVLEIDMCITCFECKISLSDFKSQNGHNFYGNRNYYVVPKELIKKIEALVPEDIGIIQYIESGDYSGLRQYKECVFKSVSDDIRWPLLYNAMKKWCDGLQK